MAINNIPWREPAAFAAGDTLLFNRRLANYLPSDGWSIQLTVSQPMPEGGAQVVNQVNSAPDPTNSYHVFNVPNFLGAADEGTFILSEEVVKAGTGERHRIYFADDFEVSANLAAGGSAGPELTLAQDMLQTIRGTLKSLYSRLATETEQQRSRFILQRIDVMRKEENYWVERRNNEIQIENARNGKTPGNVNFAAFSIGA